MTTEEERLSIRSLALVDTPTSITIARLHVIGLPDSINSLRGERVVAALYRQLATTGHQVIVACLGETIVGVIAVTDSRKPLAMARLLTVSPTRWISLAFSRPTRLFTLGQDAIAVERARADSPDHLYIASLVVAESHQRHGVGRALVTSVLDLAARDQRKVFVDTHLENHGARKLYESVGFTELCHTRLSVVLKK